MNAQPVKKWTEMTTIISLMIGMVVFQLGNTVIGVTNTINGANRQVAIDEIKQNYVTKDELVWLYKSSQEEVKTMMLYARRDSVSAMKAHEIYSELRNEMFRMMLDRSRGSGEATVNSLQ